MVALSLDDWSSHPLYNPISQVVYTATRSQVTDVWVDGSRRVQARHLVGANRELLLARAAVGSTTSARHANSAESPATQRIVIVRDARHVW